MGDAATTASSKKQINLLRGWPHPSLLPTAALTRASQRAFGNPGVITPGLLYGPDPGYGPLRESIAGWLGGFYGCENEGGGEEEEEKEKGERICITGGASQNLACVLQVFTDPVYTRVWMVAPCYFLACRIFGDAGLVTKAVPEGEEGVDLEYLERKLEEEEGKRDGTKIKIANPWAKVYRNIIYCVPTFSNPSGKTMSLACRQKLILLARKYDALIITDDVYDCLQWPTTSKTSTSSTTTSLIPRLVDIDRTLQPVPTADSFGNAMSNGSFSKIAGPGVRTGWSESTPKFAYGLSQCGSSRSGGAPSQLTATILNELLTSGDLETHIQKILNPAYQKRYEIMMQAIAQYLLPLGARVGEVSFGPKEIFGGYFIWIDLPTNIDAGVVAKRARDEEELIIAPGNIFEVAGDEEVRFRNSLRLCFAWSELGALEEGVRRLGRVVEGVRDSAGEVEEKGDGKVDLSVFR